MPTKRLTDLTVRNAKPPKAGRLEIWDKTTPGFGLRLTDKGAKSWTLMVRVGPKGSRKLRRLTLGNAKIMPLAEARKKAHAALELVEKGLDPTADGPRPGGTVAAVAGDWLERDVRKNCRPGTYDEWRRIVEHDLLPAWRERAITSITRADVSELVSRIADRGAEVQANRTFARLRRLFNWAVSQEVLSASPIAKMKPVTKERPRDRVLSDHELRWLWRACDASGWPFGPICQLLLLTAQRRDEVTGMTWDEVDLDARMWTIPRERTKSDRAHEVALSEIAVEILNALPRFSDGLVFTTNGRTPVSGFSRAKRRLDLLMNAQRRHELGLPDDAEGIPGWILHDLRRTGTTGMARFGIAPHVADKVLNHASGTISGVAAVYNKFQYLAERRAALEVWGRHVTSLVRPTESNVVALHA